MVIVSDTSPVSNLLRIGNLDLLPRLYGRIKVPSMVWSELMVLKRRGHDVSALENADWLEIKTPAQREYVIKLSATIDPGEAEAIVLAHELDADLLIIDEKDGRKAAQREGLEIVGTLGILLEAKRREFIPLVAPLMYALREKARFRISQALFEEVICLAGE